MRSPSEAKSSGPLPFVSMYRIRIGTADPKCLSKVVEPVLEALSPQAPASGHAEAKQSASRRGSAKKEKRI